MRSRPGRPTMSPMNRMRSVPEFTARLPARIVPPRWEPEAPVHAGRQSSARSRAVPLRQAVPALATRPRRLSAVPRGRTGRTRARRDEMSRCPAADSRWRALAPTMMSMPCLKTTRSDSTRTPGTSIRTSKVRLVSKTSSGGVYSPVEYSLEPRAARSSSSKS